MEMGKRRSQNICTHVHKGGIPFGIPCSPPSLTSPVPPTIADDLTDVAVTRLSPVVLTCYASGVPPPTVSWSKEGAQLGSRGGGYRVLPTGMGLGQHCPGGGGSLPAPPLPALPCLPLPALFPGALEIKRVLPAHAGRYTCTARSAAGTAQKHLRLAVHGMFGSGRRSPCALVHLGESLVGNTSLLFVEPPALKPLPSVAMVMVNTSVVLSCEATGVPRPEVTWEKDGVSITGGKWELVLPASPWPGGRFGWLNSLGVVGIPTGCWVAPSTGPPGSCPRWVQQQDPFPGDCP